MKLDSRLTRKLGNFATGANYLLQNTLIKFVSVQTYIQTYSHKSLKLPYKIATSSKDLHGGVKETKTKNTERISCNR